MPVLAFILLLFLSSSLYSQIPSSSRSKTAIKKVRPKLETRLASQKLAFGSPVHIRIFKESMELELWIKDKNSYVLFRTYEICTYGSEGLGPKLKQGDGKAPEGFYKVYPHSLNPYSSFHLSFNLGYPNAYDRAHKRTGSALMVHGSCCSIGCYAMTDESIEEIYALVDAALRNGQKTVPVHIFPFRMTDSNLEDFRDWEWFSFWNMLKKGYDLFEDSFIPPRVEVKKGRYVFADEADQEKG
ncbi:MAG: L,D-transpeptidase family protein [Chitinispirillaceae bacterium]